MVKRKKNKQDNTVLIIIGIVFLFFLINKSSLFSIYPASDGFIYYGDSDLTLSFDTVSRYIVPDEDTWKYSYSIETGWTYLNFDDSSWSFDDTFEKWSSFYVEEVAGCNEGYKASCSYTPDPCDDYPSGVASVQCDCSYRVKLLECSLGLATCEKASTDGVEGIQHCYYPTGNYNWPNSQPIYLRKKINVPEGDIYRSYIYTPNTFTCYINGNQVPAPTSTYGYVDISNYLKNGENILACTSSSITTAKFSTDMYIYYSTLDKVCQTIITEGNYGSAGTTTRTTDMPANNVDIYYTSNKQHCNNNYWDFIYGNENERWHGASQSSLSGRERSIILTAYSKSYQTGWASAKTNIDISDWDFKSELDLYLDVSNTNWPSLGGVDVVISDNAGHSQKVLSISGSGNGDFIDKGLLNIKRSIFNKDLIWIEYKGLQVAEVNWPYNKLYVSFNTWAKGDTGDGVSTTATLSLKNTRYQPLFDCELNDKDLLIMEPISGPSTINIKSLSYDVKKFCLAHPAYIIDTTKSASGANAEVYQFLVQGQSLNIPSDQIWVLFYIMDNSEEIIPTQCNEGEIYNTQLTTCTGVASICPSGFDPVTGTCATTVEVIKLQCSTDADCYSPCEGIISSCNTITNLCEFEGECEYIQPPEKVNIWSIVDSLFSTIINWIYSLFN